MKPIYIITGIPGSGKNTQASLLSKYLNIKHLDAGDTFQSIITNKIEPYWSGIEGTYNSGLPIPTEFFLKIIKDKLTSEECDRGVVLTQNTKSVDELELMLEMFKSISFDVKKVFSLEVSRESAIARVMKRLEAQFSKKDSNLEQITKRIDNYNHIYPTIREYYLNKGLLAQIDGEMSTDEVFQKILDNLNM